MRFDLLLAQYLQQHKRLDLPGIGTFETDSASVSWDENGKQKHAGNGVVFRHVPVSRAEDGLISFISEQTGKMKPLAMSDLESYLTLGKQFLYIGKPFYLEGIGTLQFSKSGQFDFMPGDFVTTKLEEPVERVEERKRPETDERSETAAGARGSGKKVLTLVALLIALGLIGWAGYYFYTTSTRQQSFVPADSASPQQDSSAAAQPAESNPSPAATMVDTTAIANPIASQPVAPSGSYRFIVEQTQDKLRALNRYRKLKSFGNDIVLEAPADSGSFRLYFILPAASSDTLRIRDSLNRWYYGNNKVNRVMVTQ